jgi:N-acetylneuraminic acid mutarotase
MTMKISKYFIHLFVLISLFSCDKDMISSDFPGVSAAEVRIEDGKYVFIGKLQGENKIAPEELGFIWQTYDDPVERPGFSTKISGNSFLAEISNSIKKGVKYSIRAYAKCGSVTIFGEKVDFTAKLDMPIILKSFEPASGYEGDTIKITGKGFNQEIKNNGVYFDNASARILSVNDSVIICIAPKQLTGGLKLLKVSTDGIEEIFHEKFVLSLLPEPEIVSISNSYVKYGSILTIYTKNIKDVNYVQLVGSSSSYLLTPLFVSKDSVLVEIYNQQNPLQLLNLNLFKVKIIMPDKSILFGPDLTLTSGWSSIKNFPGSARYKAAAFSINGKFYIGGGAGGYTYSDFWEYNLSTDTWTRKTDIPGGPRSYPRAFSDGTSGFMGAGFSGDNYSKIQLYSFYKYNPQTNTWSQIPDYPDNISNFYVGFTASVNGRLYAALSNTSITIRELVNDMWISHPSVNDMIDCPASGVMVIENKIYIITGYRVNNTVNNAVWEYDTETSVWTRKANFPGSPRYAGVSFQIGKYGYYGCGMSVTNQQYSDMWRYDNSKDKWIRISDFPGGLRSHLTSCSDGFTGIVGLGYGNTLYKYDFWRFDP